MVDLKYLIRTKAASLPVMHFIDVLKSNGIQISMDGKGRWVDNVMVERLWRSVKYERCISKPTAMFWMRRSN